MSVLSPPRAGEWAEPTPLPPLLPAASEMTSDMLPDPLKGWLADAAERASLNLEFLAAPAVVALSGVMGRSFSVMPKRADNWLVVPNLA